MKNKILIVDDDQSTVRIIETCIRTLCDETFTAFDAKTAWKLYTKENPNLVITDYRMPEVDGYVFACMIDKEPNSCPVILVTDIPQ